MGVRGGCNAQYSTVMYLTPVGYTTVPTTVYSTLSVVLQILPIFANIFQSYCSCDEQKKAVILFLSAKILL